MYIKKYIYICFFCIYIYICFPLVTILNLVSKFDIRSNEQSQNYAQDLTSEATGSLEWHLQGRLQDFATSPKRSQANGMVESNVVE